MQTNSFDLNILHFINHSTNHSQGFDQFISMLASNNFIGGGWLTIFFWWFWFYGDEAKREINRPFVTCTLFSCYVSLFLARVVSFIAPYRTRPLIDPPLDFIPSAALSNKAYVDWSSFPSDHAVLFFVIATGLFFISRKLGILTYLYATLLICLPRIYLGIHFPTDIIAGAFLGIIITYLIIWIKEIREPLSNLTYNWSEMHPASFYVFFFLLTFMIATKFGELKGLVHSQ